MAKKNTILSRPKGKSFKEFKAWISELSSRLGAKDTLTDAELKERWLKFWKKAESASK